MYNKFFYSSRRQWAQSAAERLLVHVIQLLRPKSLLDVGCGDGVWLSVARDAGVGEICGLEGEWVANADLAVDKAVIVTGDLTKEWKIVRRFDLVMSLEVAEHLPEAAADEFIQRLCRASSVVLFSGAIPGQGGLHHVNEQWQSYWVEKFAKQGYEVFDVLRPQFWQEESVPYWYRQNVMLFVDSKVSASFPQLIEAREAGDFRGADLVHPAHAMRAIQFPGIVALVRALPYAVARSFVTFFSRAPKDDSPVLPASDAVKKTGSSPTQR